MTIKKGLLIGLLFTIALWALYYLAGYWGAHTSLWGNYWNNSLDAAVRPFIFILAPFLVLFGWGGWGSSYVPLWIMDIVFYALLGAGVSFVSQRFGKITYWTTFVLIIIIAILNIFGGLDEIKFEAKLKECSEKFGLAGDYAVVNDSTVSEEDKFIFRNSDHIYTRAEYNALQKQVNDCRGIH